MSEFEMEFLNMLFSFMLPLEYGNNRIKKNYSQPILYYQIKFKKKKKN